VLTECAKAKVPGERLLLGPRARLALARHVRRSYVALNSACILLAYADGLLLHAHLHPPSSTFHPQRPQVVASLAIVAWVSVLSVGAYLDLERRVGLRPVA
jgi:hypothetical protein